MKRLFVLLLTLPMVFGMAACRGRSGQPEQTAPPTTVCTTATTPVKDEADSSLIIFRQTMVETPQRLAVAFFGYVPQDADPFEIMREAAPQLCEDLPFLLTIGKENVIGAYGYLFCIVPADETASVAVNHSLWNTEKGSYEEPEVLYRSESGSPILVMCPNEDWMPDTEVTITDATGAVTVWNPYLDLRYHLSDLCNAEGDSLIFDFTAYDALALNLEVDSSDLVGAWELAWTEVEGDRNEAEPGTSIIQITAGETGAFRFTYSSRDFPEENIQDRALRIVPGKLYPGCGNNHWIGEVAEADGDTVAYALALLEDGTLLLQVYWEMDGMQWVSYGWYEKK